MHTKIFTLCCLLFILCGVQAQVTNDSPSSFSKISSFKLIAVNQQKDTFIYLNNPSLSLFIFLSPECPLCQNYSKVVNQLNQQFKNQVAIYGIVPGKTYTIKDVIAFKNKYLTTFNLFIDKKQLLTHYLNATVTPQVIRAE